MKKTSKVVAPCSITTQSLTWNVNSSCFSGSKKWAKKWIDLGMEERLTSCCKLFRTILSYSNLNDIFQIMKFSLGQQLPKPLYEISKFTASQYKTLFPNDGELASISNIG